MRVFVYYNLHRHLWSVKCLKTGRVVYHTRNLTLTQCEFRVSKRGRERVLQEKRKNVHAGVVGTLIALDHRPSNFHAKREVTYNPYKYETFVSKLDSSPVYQADTVVMDANTVPKVYHW